LHIFQGDVRMSCGVIHVKNYVLKVSTIEEVGLELLTSSNHCGCPYFLLLYILIKIKMASQRSCNIQGDRYPWLQITDNIYSIHFFLRGSIHFLSRVGLIRCSTNIVWTALRPADHAAVSTLFSQISLTCGHDEVEYCQGQATCTLLLCKLNNSFQENHCHIHDLAYLMDNSVIMYCTQTVL
jgi:hypothetical protein